MTKKLIIAMCGIVVLSLIIAITTIPQTPIFVETTTQNTAIVDSTTMPETSTTDVTTTQPTTQETSASTTETETEISSSTVTKVTEKKITTTSSTITSTTVIPTTRIETTVVPTTAEASHVSTPTFSGPTSSELEALELINAEREKVGLSPLTFNYRLYNCAKLRATETKTCLSHTRPNGKRFDTVLDDYNLSRKNRLGENILYDYYYVTTAINVLMGSETHKANILNPHYTSVAIGVVQLDNGYYTMVQLFEG